MSNTFDDLDDDEVEETKPSVKPTKFYMTPTGFAALQAECKHLQRDVRPKIVEIVSWAAGNGDRSENGDYLYNKKRLREIDRRVRYIIKRLENATVVDPKDQKGLTQIYFGATVTYTNSEAIKNTVTLVGEDEADAELAKINFLSPIGQSLLKAKVGDTVKVSAAGKSEFYTVESINYGVTL